MITDCFVLRIYNLMRCSRNTLTVKSIIYHKFSFREATERDWRHQIPDLKA